MTEGRQDRITEIVGCNRSGRVSLERMVKTQVIALDDLRRYKRGWLRGASTRLLMTTLPDSRVAPPPPDAPPPYLLGLEDGRVGRTPCWPPEEQER